MNNGILTEVYIGLGSNLGDSMLIIQKALDLIKALPGIHQLEISHFYQTSPLGNTHQNSFINAVCRFKTSLEAHELLHSLQKIEAFLGKKPKGKYEPRLIDLDILLFGLEWHQDEELTVPHPHWQERLFVLVPLSDLVVELKIPQADGSLLAFNVKTYLQHFNNPNQETVISIPTT